MRTLGFALAMCLAGPMAGGAQNVAEMTKHFEAARYEEVVTALDAAEKQGELNPSGVYLAAQSRQRMQQAEAALHLYHGLAARGEKDPWRHIGESAIHQMEKRLDQATAAASRATTLAPGLFEAHYQLGLAHFAREDFARAAAAFDRAIQIAPVFAYARYYGGLAHYRSKRVDRMATHFEHFLKIAPEAPERPEVESILRTVRGR